MNILFTGDRGFIAGYAIRTLLNNGHKVFGIDSCWKYGPVEKSYDNHENYIHYTKDVKDTEFLKYQLEDKKIDVFVAGAAIIGGISMFHAFAYDLLAENERITASSFDAAIHAFRYTKNLKKIVVLSSSMVYECAYEFPTPEGHQKVCAPPMSTYGFQKLATEYFAKGAFEQYKLPYTIVRPFNCVGIGEKRAKVDKEIMSGNVKLALSHVVPDLVQKILKGQNPLHILGTGNQIRHYTYGGDLAEGIYKCIISPNALNNDFNLSTPKGHTVIELAKIIWEKINGNKSFSYVLDPSFEYDVQCRIPATNKAKELLGFEAETSLETALDEIIPWIKHMIELNQI